ncbi:MAG: S-layer protein [Candidatus Aramenus sulfurataquae]|uniref:S-layer protein n=1 Tax=Candidatus Aramenus sulfurataquae TaxID=1326980 RepID=W7KNZ5_9CREN|nr:MAG: S-layer protein [Candidatus Aramenus sulfurataquae]
MSIYAPQYPGYPVSLYIYGPDGIKMNAPVGIGNIGSNGAENSTVMLLSSSFEQNGQPLAQFVPGEYVVVLTISDVYTANITIYLTSANITTLDVTAYSQGQPLPGATIEVYSSTGAYLNQSVTGPNGAALIQVPYNPTTGSTYKVVLTKAGYEENSTTVTVPPNFFGQYMVKIYTQPVVLAATPVYFQDMGIRENVTTPINGVYAAGAFENSTFSTIVYVTMMGEPVTSATVTATYNGMTVTGKSIGNGLYNVSITIPVLTDNVPYVLDVNVTATYQGTTAEFSVQVVATPNLYQEIATLQTEVSNLENEVSVLKSELSGNVTILEQNISTLKTQISVLESNISNINSELATLKNDVASLNSTVGSLSSTVNNLKSEVSSLQTEVSSLNSTVSSLQSEVNSLNGIKTLVYAGLALAVIGLIIAIVAIVLVMRKVA